MLNRFACRRLHKRFEKLRQIPLLIPLLIRCLEEPQIEFIVQNIGEASCNNHRNTGPKVSHG